MRATLLVSFAMLGAAILLARADETLHSSDSPPVDPANPFNQRIPFVTVGMSLGSHAGYIVPEEYANAHKAEIVASIPGGPHIDKFWTPSETNVEVADRVLREMVEAAAKDPSTQYPELAEAKGNEAASMLAQEQVQFQGVVDNYDRYNRQYIGVVIDKVKLVFCNYADA